MTSGQGFFSNSGGCRFERTQTNHQVKHLSWDGKLTMNAFLPLQLHAVVKGTGGETLMCPTVTVSTEIH